MAPRAASQGWHLLAVSAKTAAALEQAVRNLAEHLRRHPQTGLGDASYTLLAGRTAFEHRFAVVCKGAADAVARFEARASLEDLPEARPLVDAGRRWLAGEPIDAAALFTGQERRIPLPTYPFERHRYWIEPGNGIEPGAATVSAVPLAPVQTLHARPELLTPYVAPRGELEERVARIWGEMLGLAQVGVQDSFMELGGDSLLATRLMARLREDFGVDLAMDRLFEQPTVAAVAAAVVEARAAGAGEEDLARLLSEISALSDEELEGELRG